MKEYVVGPNEEGKRLDKFLKVVLDNAPDSFIYKMLRKKNIKVNDKKASGNEKLSLNDSVKIYLSDETFELMQKPKGNITSEYEWAFRCLKGIEVIYECDDIIIFYKPQGILAQKADKKDLSLNEYLIGYLLNKNVICEGDLRTFKPSVCNRLDRNTDGLVICSKTLKGSRYASQIIKDRTVKKYYYAICKGIVKNGSLVTGYLKKDNDSNKVVILKDDPQNEEYSFIKTGYDPIKYFEDATLLEIELITGKPHQIRAHLASIGHPILGDMKYGDAGFNRKYDAKMQYLTAVRLEFPLGDFIPSMDGRNIILNNEAMKKYEYLEKPRS